MTEKEYIKMISDKLNKMNEYEERRKLAEKKNHTEIDRLVKLVNRILSNHGVSEKIDKTHIRFNADYAGNITWIDDKKLSEIIFEHIYPTPKKKLYSHYTGFETGKSILEKEEFWLFNLIQNFDAEEFKLFYREHGLRGYEKNKQTFGIWTGYRPLMSEIFALCLTSEENTSPTLWNYFANKSTGIKLTFEVESKIPDFREVYYSNTNKPQQIPLLKELFEQIEKEFKYPFNFTYMSKIGAFYIKGDFSNEDEYRFLIKRTSDSYNAWGLQPITFQNDIEYIVLPFKSDYADFNLKKIEKGENCCDKDFASIEKIASKKYPWTQIKK